MKLKLGLLFGFFACALGLQAQKNASSKWSKPEETGFFKSLSRAKSASYQASFDYQLLPRSGAENLTALLRAPYAPWKDKSKRANRRAWWRIALRATKLVFLDYAAADYYTTLQRELFGTGAYARILGRDSIKYQITPFSIFSKPTISYSLPVDSLRSITLDEQVALALAGFESTGNSMTEVLRQKFLSGGELSHEMALLYLTNKFDQVRQVLNASTNFNNLTTSNIESYVYNLNLRYLDSNTVALGRGAIDSFKYSLGGLKTKALLSIFLDPTLYFSAANVYGFLVDAKKYQGLKALRLGSWGYFPTVHFGLSPYGEEWYWHNYLVDSRQHIWHLKLRFGNSPYSGVSWSAALNCANFYFEKVGTFNARAEVWQQPDFTIGKTDLSLENLGGFGGMFTASFRSEPLSKLFPIQVYGEIGYKSGGYVAGENLDKSMIARVGISYPNFFGKGEKEERQAEYSSGK